MTYDSAKRSATLALVAALAVFWMPGVAQAAGPRPWEIGLQPAASPLAHQEHSFFLLLMVIITLITLFVLALLLYCMFRFNAKSNPVPSKTSHNTLVEVLWTVVPIMILIVIAIPSFKLLYEADKTADADMTIKAIGNQWYWSYEYPDQGNFTFDAVMLEDDELQAGQPRLLATDNAIVLPVDTKIRVLVTGSDVIHSWAMPAFGVKIDAVPGRLNEVWIQIEEPGMYYGQCSELCGIRHGFMPIMIKAVAKPEFDDWVKRAREEFARVDAPAVAVADASGPTRR